MKIMDLNAFDDDELIASYSSILYEMKKRGIIRSKNVTGDLGEYIAINHYCKNTKLPKLQFAPPSTKNIDAISINGERYSIKTTTRNVTGVFYGIPKNANIDKIDKAFEYLIIVKLNECYLPVLIVEIDWETFFEFKHWHPRVKAFNISLTKKLLEKARIIYKMNSN